jgi:hypothetical protein
MATIDPDFGMIDRTIVKGVTVGGLQTDPQQQQDCQSKNQAKIMG